MNNPFFNLIRLSWNFAGAMRKKLALAYAMLVMSNIIDLTKPFVFGLLINTIQQGSDHLLRDCLLILGVYYTIPLLFWFFHGLGRVIERSASFEINKNYIEHNFGLVTELPLRWHRDHHSGDTIDRMKKAANAIMDFSEETFIPISVIIKFIVSLTAIISISASVGLWSLLFCLSLIIVVLKFDKKIFRMIRKVNQREHSIASTIHDYVTNIVTVITLRIEKLSQKAVSQKILARYEPYQQLIRFNETKWFAVSMLLNLMSLFIVSAYIYRILSSGQSLMLGSVTMLFQYVERLNFAFFDFAWQYEFIVRQDANIRSLDPLLLAHDSVLPDMSQPEVTKWHAIKIRNLHFHYTNSEEKRASLVNMDLELIRGRKVALVGESGSGKSTLMILLRGLLEPGRVELSVDGKRFSSLRPISHLSSLFPQDPEIFDNTIEYNITAGLAHREEDVHIAAQIACFDQVAQRLPQGYQTDVKEKGVNLSGGEKQRLALARGIFTASDSSLILLDEPTSSVDPVNEARIYGNILRHFAGRCVVSSLHKLHLLPMFDWIYVLEQGRIIEQGKLASLLQKPGILHRMWDEYNK